MFSIVNAYQASLLCPGITTETVSKILCEFFFESTYQNLSTFPKK